MLVPISALVVENEIALDPGLVKSIRQVGVLLPIVVMPADGGKYRVIDGRRRVAAARKAGLMEVPAVVAEDADPTVASLHANLHRSSNLVHEARAVRELLKRGLGEREMAEVLAIPVGRVKALVRWAALPDEVLEALAEGRISRGAARMLLGENKDWLQKIALGLLREKEKVTVRDLREARREHLERAAARVTALIDLAEYDIPVSAQNPADTKMCVWQPALEGRKTSCGRIFPKAYEGAVLAFRYCPFCGKPLKEATDGTD